MFGSGVQARAHLVAFARAFPLRAVRIVARSAAHDIVALAQSLVGSVRTTDARAAVDGADLVVTATRSAEPLFDGRWAAPGAFVAAVGSSKPETRETDDALIARASAVVVEWREQALSEAGDLVRADPAVLARAPLIELGPAVAGDPVHVRAEGDVVLFKSVGVGLEDVAVAAAVMERASAPARG